MTIILAVGVSAAVLATVFAYFGVTAQVVEPEVIFAIARMNECEPSACPPVERNVITSHSELEDALARTDRGFEIFNKDCNSNDECVWDKWQGEVDRRTRLEVPESEARSILQSLRDSGVEIHCVGHLCESAAAGFQTQNKTYWIRANIPG